LLTSGNKEKLLRNCDRRNKIPVTDTISVGANPRRLAITPNGAYVYVANGGSDNVSVINTSTNTVDVVLPVGDGPLDVAFTSDGAFAYIANANAGSMSVINTATYTSSIVVAGLSGPHGVAITPNSSPSFSCVGFESPMDGGAVRVKKNRALPHKAQLLDEMGSPLNDLDIAAPPVIQVIFDSDTVVAQDVTSEAYPAGAGSEGNQFEFLDSKWQFNLKAKNYTAAGTYTTMMESGDISEYVIADPKCTGVFVIN
jgi:YVTN family beta-propeller protein